MNAEDLNPQELAEALGRIPHLAPPAMAATQLLIAHRYWLRRLEMRPAFDVELEDGLLFAWVDWDRACRLVDRLPCSPSEGSVMRLACLIAGRVAAAPDHRWTLRDILSDLDRDNATLAITAFTAAAVGGRL